MSAVSANFIAGAARFLAAPSVRWHDEPSVHRQSVFFANHTSHLDFLVLWSALPPAQRAKTRPIASKDYWEHGLRHRVSVEVFHAVLVERCQSLCPLEREMAARRTIATLAEFLCCGESLIVFPEGGRQETPDMAAFKSGLYHLWTQCPGVQFIPVYLQNLDRILPKGEVLPVPAMTSVTFGAPLRLYAGESKESVLYKARTALQELSAA